MIESLENRRVLANFEVTSLLDTTDATDGVITLREAIASANEAAGADTITFAPSLSGSIVLTQSELPITDSVQIVGPGSGLLAIDANQQSRVIAVQSDRSLIVSLEGLTIRDGKTTANNENGAGIRFNSPGGRLGLVDSVISGNLTEGIAAQGGGIYASRGDVVLTRSTVQGNQTSNGSSSGGGIATVYANVSLIDSKVLNNRTLGQQASGGGVFTVSGAVALTGSTVSGNSTAGGFAYGGGISTVSGVVTLTGSTVSGNNTAGSTARGGGIHTSNGAVTLTGSTVSGNSTSGDRAHGGGILTGFGVVTLTGSTVSGNRVTGTNSDGGGVWFDDSVVTIVNSTITANSATRAGGGLGMLVDTTDKKLTILNSIIAGNTATSNPDFTAPSTPATNLEVRSSLIGNLQGTTLTPAATANTNGNLIGDPNATPPVLIDPKLGPLGFNGGVTQTHALLPGSPAINAGNNGLVASQTNDQRGAPFVRQSGVVDIGAYELQTLDSTFFIVTTLNDELDYSNTHVSLREAINSGNGSPGADTITFAPGLSGSILLSGTLGQLPITDSVQIDGQGASNTIVNAGRQGFRVIDVMGQNVDVTINGMTITGGQTVSSGGGINFVSEGRLTVNNSTISGNASELSGGGVSSGSGGTATFNNSTLSDNSAATGGGLFNFGTAIFNNSTLSGNSSLNEGGGLYNSGVALLSHTTLSGNTASSGGGLRINGGTTRLQNSIVAGNTSGGDISGNVDLITSSSNLIGDPASAGGLTHGTNGNILGTANGSGRALIDITTVLGPLAFNGGTTMTHALVTNSPAINAGNNTLIVTGQNNDQRGNPFARIFNDDVDRVDIGAYEFQTFAPSSFVVTTLADELDFTNATVSLREAIHVANGNPGIDTITFDNSLTSAGPATITLTQGELLITDSVTIVGAPVTSPATPGETLLTVDANRLSRIVNVKGTATKPVDLTIEGLTLTGGNIANGEGAGILFDSAGKLNLTDSTVSSSRTTGENGFGAGIYTDSGEITLLRSKVSGNGTEGFNALGGGIHSYSGKLLLNDSLISENYTRGTFAAGGGIVVGSAEVVLSNSIVESNFTTGADAIGGGITSFGGLLTLENGSKVRGNRTQGANAVGGGIAKFSGDLLVTASEVVSNFVQGENSQGGGIFSQSGDVRIERSLVSGNATEAANSPGGGISVDTGQVILVQSTISDNSTQQNNSIGGGIFSNRGNVLLDRSTMSGNSTSGNSAAGGGIASNSGDIRVVNSTVSGNQTTGIDSSGGGLWTLLGDVTLLNSTVAFNQTAANAKGGGLFVNFDSGQNLGSLTIQNSIVARNSVATTGEGPDLFLQNFQATTILSVVHSLIGNNANTTLMAAPVGMPVSQFSLIGTAATPIDPLLGPLAFNGGPTQTHALLQGSPAINKGNDALATTISDDQRGAPFGRKNGVVDMGAYELQTLGASFFIVTTLDDELDYSNSAVSLREAINSANGSPGVETITFASTVNGSINLSPTLGQLQITNSVNITGNGAASTIVDAGRQGFRVIEVIGSLVDVSLTGVTITGGQTTGNGGGINFASTGKLTVNNSTLSGNSATYGGGLFNRITLTLTNSTLSGNSATNGGGLFNRGDATVTNSTFSGNSALYGGGVYNRGGLTLANNTLSGNSAGQNGGGLLNRTAVTLTNNTLSGNSATNGGGGISNGNQATLNNNIVANSLGGDIVAQPSSNATFVGSRNLVGPGSPATGSLGNLTVTIVGDPKLGPLQDNGGPTFTHALLAGSPALDAGNQTPLPAGITTDQRGVARIIDLPGITAPGSSPVDIGAVEMVGVSIADVSANENAGTLDFVVTLSHAIPLGLTVSVQVDTAAINGGATAGVDYTAIANQTVTFTSADPLTKTVSVTIANDLIDEANETFQVNLSNASGAIITRASAIGTITDDDVRGITVSAISGNTTETGDTATFTVVLTSQPTADVTIPLTSSDTTEGTVAPATLTFTPANWNVAQTVTVTGVNDDIDDGDIAFNIVTGAATGGDYAGLNANDVAVTNVDNDTRGITVSAISGNTTEAGGTATFTMVLNSQPTADVTIPLSSNDLTEGTVAPATLTFTPTNWNVAQTVTVTGVNDNVDDGDIAFNIVTAAATGGDYAGLNANDIAVTNVDNDTRGITVSAISGNTTEAGGTATFTMVLTSQPTADVTIPLSSSNTTEGTVAPATLTFTPTNWNVRRTVTVTGVNDIVDDGDIAFNIVTAAATGGDYAGLNANDVAVTNVDNDTRGITVSAISGNTTEAGGTATFTVALTSQPTANVTIPLSSSDTTEGTVAQATLTFTPTNWNVRRTVIVTGVNDNVDDGDIAFNIVTAAATGGDYAGLNANDVAVTNVDNDTRGITVSAISGNTTEAGGTATFTVVLTSEPTANVNIPLSSSDLTEGTVAPATLTFTPTNWNVAQTVTVTGVNDDIDDGDIAFNIVTGAATGGDYAGLNANDVAVMNIDNDEPPTVTLTRDKAEIAEPNDTATFTVTLSTTTSLPVTVNLAFSGTATLTSDYTRTGTQIVIQPGQTTGSLSVTAVPDSLAEPNETIIVDISSVTNGTEATPQQATVILNDDGPRLFVVNTATDEFDFSNTAVSLREAIHVANRRNDLNTITFDPSLSTPIVLTLGELVITESVIISGLGVARTVIDGDEKSRVINVTSNTANVTLRDLTIQNGLLDRASGQVAGAGIRFQSTGTLSLVNTTITSNEITSSVPSTGGGVFANNGTVSIVNSTISGNFAASGGGVYAGAALNVTGSTFHANEARIGGAIFARATSVVTNSTISYNRATTEAGGIKSTGNFTLTNSTVVDNRSSLNTGGIEATNLTILNSILADNTDTRGTPNLSRTPQTIRFSLVDNAQGTGLSASPVTAPDLNGVRVFTADTNGNFIGAPNLQIDPKLGPLEFNGGPTKTHDLLPGSLAINSGDPATTTTLTADQRGLPFVRRDGRIDMGAVESQTPAASLFVVTTENDELDFTNSLVSLREAITLANLETNVDNISFATSVTKPIMLSLGALPITNPVNLTGIANQPIIIDAGQKSRVFEISETAGDVNLSLLTIRNGKTTLADQHGGGIFSASPGLLTLRSSTVSGSSVANIPEDKGVPAVRAFGGGISASNVLLINSTVSGNAAASGGAINSSVVTLINSTISGNTASQGGAINSSNVTLINSTISGNTASNGGAISADSLTLTNSTVTLNTSTEQNTGAIDANQVLVNNSIVAGNIAPANPRASDIVTRRATINASLIGNLPSVGPDTVISVDSRIATDPRLGPLQANGGATFTHAPLSNSPAIDGGRNVLAVNETGAELLTDQRGTGFARINGTRVDIGAFETGTPSTFDFGDAPSTYPVLLANDGARHTISSLRLGATVDAENDGRVNATATGDTVGDDGVIMLTSLVAVAGTATTSSISVNASGTGKLDAWIDFNRDGDWNDAGEQIVVSANLVQGDNLVSFTVPATTSTSAGGNTFARFRFSSVGNLTPGGAAADGEVEDYLAAIVTGSTTAALNIEIPGGDTNVVVEGDNLVVRKGTTIISQVPFSSFGELKLNGSSIDDILQLKILESLLFQVLEFDGGLGKDFLELVAAGETLDLTNARITLRDVEGVDITGTGANRLVISIDAVKNASSTTDTLEVVSDTDDTITFVNGFKVDTPTFINGEFTHIITETVEGGTARVELRNGRPLTNPLTPFDADRNGRIQPLDALRIINELSRRGAGPITLPTNDGEISRLYVDVSGDSQLTALDALRVINAIARISSGASGEGEAASVLAAPDQPKANESIDSKAVSETTSVSTEITSSRSQRATPQTLVPELSSHAVDKFFVGYDDEEPSVEAFQLQLLSSNQP